MPKATMDKERRLARGKYKVRTSRKAATSQAVPESTLVQATSHEKFSGSPVLANTLHAR